LGSSQHPREFFDRLSFVASGLVDQRLEHLSFQHAPISSRPFGGTCKMLEQRRGLTRFTLGQPDAG
jgi:hypothetical protein